MILMESLLTVLEIGIEQRKNHECIRPNFPIKQSVDFFLCIAQSPVTREMDSLQYR